VGKDISIKEKAQVESDFRQKKRRGSRNQGKRKPVGRSQARGESGKFPDRVSTDPGGILRIGESRGGKRNANVRSANRDPNTEKTRGPSPEQGAKHLICARFLGTCSMFCGRTKRFEGLAKTILGQGEDSGYPLSTHAT